MLARVFNEDQLNCWVESSSKHDICTGDALMALKISGNELSFWEVQEDELGQVALAWNSYRDKPQGVFVAYLDTEEITKEVDSNDEEAKTAIVDLRKKHRNLTNLNYWSIGSLCAHLTQQIKKQKYVYFDEGDIYDMFIDAIEKGRLDIKDLHEKLQNKLSNEILRRKKEAAN